MRNNNTQVETYSDFLSRIGKFEKPEISLPADYLDPRQSLLQKVGEDNKFCSFFGDTVVFELDSITKKYVSELAEQIRSKAPECFCEEILPETFHVTLHDLSSSEKLENVSQIMLENEKLIRKVWKEKKAEFEQIHMETNFIINMVNISLVLALKPASEEDYNKLMSLYYQIDEIKNIPFPTPHITLAYYNRNGFGRQEINKLTEIVNVLNKKSFEVQLHTKNLVYQHFTSMNNYTNILRY